MQLYSFLEGLRINVLDNTIAIKYRSVRKYLDQDETNLFEIKSKNEKFYIAASFLKIFEKRLEHYESSLTFTSTGQKKLIAHFP